MVQFGSDLKQGLRHDWGYLPKSARAKAFVDLAKTLDKPLLVIVNDSHDGQDLLMDCRFFAGDLPVEYLPDWEMLPYDPFSPHEELISERLNLFYRLPTMQSGIVITSLYAALYRLCPPDYVAQHVFKLSLGDTLNMTLFCRNLVDRGYQSVSQVIRHGEFCQRGGIIDIFPAGSLTPYRIDCFDDEVESIRLFDVDSQRSTGKTSDIKLLPARECPSDEESLLKFRERFRERFPESRQSPIFQAAKDGLLASGIEFYLPLFFTHLADIFDYFDAQAVVAFDGQLEKKASEYTQEFHQRYESLNIDKDRPLLPPQELFLAADEIFAKLKNFTRIRFHHDSQLPYQAPFQAEKIPAMVVSGHADAIPKSFSLIKEDKRRILVVAESLGRREILRHLFEKQQFKLQETVNFDAFMADDAPLMLVVGHLSQGFQCENFAVYTEDELLGRRVVSTGRKKSHQDFDAVVKSLAELALGDPIVHIEFGIGRYQGLQMLDVGGKPEEFLVILYASDDKLYVPVSNLELISHYSGGDKKNAPLHALGSDKWQKDKEKALKKAEDVAVELLDIYAKREARQGISIVCNDSEYLDFCEAFDFEETADQEAAIYQVLADLKHPKPMDRLVCGDVGFGKTEVALRAAFATIGSGLQVAILVPTTLLAQQHFETFQDRFAKWPVKVALLSRFNSAKETREILTGLESGTIDIVIGTHKLIQRTVKFKRLGLLILDEEHRFGVKQKEAIKAFKSEVDILTLTATPIPRTLNMAMSGVRDLSIIATPPQKRLAVKTFVREKNKGLVKEAIMRELHRGGQIYYLHNDVATIQNTAKEIETLIPEARIAIAHGQMPERQLEVVMRDFYHQRINILVCTTIIETGIDVPTANTMIIEKANHFGLSQLHQLRGRVGRSHHQAYAYLLIPPKNTLTTDALRRLEAIESFEDLGAGFMLASHDLEIRGAGEFLGAEQSGHINRIGFSLYVSLLEKAVESLKVGQKISLDEWQRTLEVDLGESAMISEDYMPDVHMRLIEYKRIASAKDKDALRDLQVEMIDRFGLMPESLKCLFDVAMLKVILKPLGIRKLQMHESGGSIFFGENTHVDPLKMIQLIQEKRSIYQLASGDKLKFTLPFKKREEKITFIERLVERLGT